jgi:hypothetical protein
VGCDLVLPPWKAGGSLLTMYLSLGLEPHPRGMQLYFICNLVHAVHSSFICICPDLEIVTLWWQGSHHKARKEASHQNQLHP